MKKIGKPSVKNGPMGKSTKINARVAPKSAMKSGGNSGKTRTGMTKGNGKGATGF